MCKAHGVVRQEPLEWLSKTPGYTKRFAYYVGKRCQSSSITDVAKELRLDWKTVKNLEKEYMQEKLRRAGDSEPAIIGIDEISMRKGHTYRIVVSDLEEKRPIWFGGLDRSATSMDMFYQTLNSSQKEKIRLAVMDMWKAFENSAQTHIPQAAILYDKFHVIRHLNEALDNVRKQEYRKAQEKDKRFIKGQKYTLLSRKANLTTPGKRALQDLLRVNKRLNTAYILKESFLRLWDYRSEGWARRFFDNWKASLKWKRLEPYKKFAEMIERHWEGIAAYCKPENRISLGFIEGLNNKIRVIQRRAYGLRDEEYIRLKVLTCTLPDFDDS
jgi:transposase